MGSRVILQSFVQESLHSFNAMTNGCVPTMFLMGAQDLDVWNENDVTETMLRWVLTFCKVIGISASRSAALIEARDEFALDFEVTAYTLINAVEDYVSAINDGLMGVFSDSVGT